MKLGVRLSHKTKYHESYIVVSEYRKICSDLPMKKIKCEA